ncbi:MAG: hypothetical protein ACUVXI_14690 [bacterium]
MKNGPLTLFWISLAIVIFCFGAWAAGEGRVRGGFGFGAGPGYAGGSLSLSYGITERTDFRGTLKYAYIFGDEGDWDIASGNADLILRPLELPSLKPYVGGGPGADVLTVFTRPEDRFGRVIPSLRALVGAEIPLAGNISTYGEATYIYYLREEDRQKLNWLDWSAGISVGF